MMEMNTQSTRGHLPWHLCVGGMNTLQREEKSKTVLIKQET